jgi:hypothetical protein
MVFQFTIGIDIPAGVPLSSIKGNAHSQARISNSIGLLVALIDLGFSTHAFHSSGRLVFMDHILSPNRRSLTITSPPNNRVYPPGPAYIFVTVGDTTSVGAHVMVGSGANPPVPDQGENLSRRHRVYYIDACSRHSPSWLVSQLGSFDGRFLSVNMKI